MSGHVLVLLLVWQRDDHVRAFDPHLDRFEPIARVAVGHPVRMSNSNPCQGQPIFILVSENFRPLLVRSSATTSSTLAMTLALTGRSAEVRTNILVGKELAAELEHSDLDALKISIDFTTGIAESGGGPNIDRICIPRIDLKIAGTHCARSHEPAAPPLGRGTRSTLTGPTD